MSSSTLTPTHSLAHDPQTTIKMWLEEAETVARNLCPQHDPTGALTLARCHRRRLARNARQHRQPRRSPPRRPAPIPGPPNMGSTCSTREQCSRRSSVDLQARAHAPLGLHPPWLKAPWQGPYWLASAKPTSFSSRRPTQTSKPTLSLRARSRIPCWLSMASRPATTSTSSGNPSLEPWRRCRTSRATWETSCWPRSVWHGAVKGKPRTVH